jgi:hypothetical protein
MPRASARGCYVLAGEKSLFSFSTCSSSFFANWKEHGKAEDGVQDIECHPAKP